MQLAFRSTIFIYQEIFIDNLLEFQYLLMNKKLIFYKTFYALIFDIILISHD